MDFIRPEPVPWDCKRPDLVPVGVADVGGGVRLGGGTDGDDEVQLSLSLLKDYEMRI